MEQKRIVIIGAGVVGCSTAYYLNKMGQQDITVIDQGPLFETGGSTSHAPGLVAQLNFSKLLTAFASQTVADFTELGDGERPSYYPVGSLELARTPERLNDLKRKAGAGKSWGIEAHVLSPKECKEKNPVINPDTILGGLYVPTDGIAKPLRAINRMADFSKSCGTKFYGNTEVTGINMIDDQVKGVETSIGDFEADLVICCAGFWGPQIGEMAGVTIPLQPIAHQYIFSNDIPELAGESEEVTSPIIRDLDSSMYYRQVFNSIGIGSYQHEALPIEISEVSKYGESADMPSIKPFTPEHFLGKPWKDAQNLIPGLKEAGRKRGINGIFSFTPDGMPLLGESEKIRGFWVAEAVWITHSAGVGKQMAEWIINGAPTLDLELCDINRFDSYAQSPTYYKPRSKEDYEKVYDIHHPFETPATSRNMRIIPYYIRQQTLGAFFNESLGWEQPQWYEANESLTERYENRIIKRDGWQARYWSPIIEAEHLHIQEHAGLYDVTAMNKRLEISGEDALTFLQTLTTSNIDISIGSMTNALMLHELGGIKDKITIIRKDNQTFIILCTSAVEANWIQKHVWKSGEIVIQDKTASTCGLGIIGPGARDVMQSIDPQVFAEGAWEAKQVKEIYINNIPVLAAFDSKCGLEYWEFFTTNDQGLPLWDVLYQAGQANELIAVGDRALESLRIESQTLRYGKDFWSEHNPYEINLNAWIDLTKDFIGKKALIERGKKGPNLVSSTLVLDQPDKVVMGHEPVMNNGKTAGFVTSAGFSYSLGRGIVTALLDPKALENDTEWNIEYFGQKISATVLQKHNIIT
ncbi:glycine cleavage system aminomethyltransferase T/glycine/D-amino acid oxidase-like deaminating enzyme [Virgibacillus natechei]|uniref:Glycine cleavage system aminomethyltransferase T/glycine/D-amino acid oxidase-like deaminating enzyme n=1 Tax=Virgibacillus natechei TaxID=1216297 RepID=A0ABS4IDS8_9BACI|nr:FAD-dependent oxidoreductase [Virgibacillus natechei]MBP1969100.1 glycine cleavage system aminomethyltransferase T/glycine/D-amino acid oxidase-like deaminating enzyme [Virgibacillus natechei]UZD14366.1 FAD-dependent oxidoreductase [Virgibacillus natechei]